MIEKIETPKSGGIGLVLHEKMDFDVDFQKLSSRTKKMSRKTSYCFTEST